MLVAGDNGDPQGGIRGLPGPPCKSETVEREAARLPEGAWGLPAPTPRSVATSFVLRASFLRISPFPKLQIENPKLPAPTGVNPLAGQGPGKPSPETSTAMRPHPGTSQPQRHLVS